MQQIMGRTCKELVRMQWIVSRMWSGFVTMQWNVGVQQIRLTVHIREDDETGKHQHNFNCGRWRQTTQSLASSLFVPTFYSKSFTPKYTEHHLCRWTVDVRLVSFLPFILFILLPSESPSSFISSCHYLSIFMSSCHYLIIFFHPSFPEHGYPTLHPFFLTTWLSKLFSWPLFPAT